MILIHLLFVHSVHLCVGINRSTIDLGKKKKVVVTWIHMKILGVIVRFV